MNASPLLLCAVLLFPMGVPAEAAESWVERLIATHAPIESLRCEIRRERTVEGKTFTRVSRVWYARGKRLRVETLAPLPTRVLADGTTLYKWLDDKPEGVSMPISEAPENEQVQLEQVPGTPEEYLFRLRGAPEEHLAPTPEYAVRIGCHPPHPHPYTVLSLDASNRLVRLEYFGPNGGTNRLLLALFSNWSEVLPGVRIPCLHQITIWGSDGVPIEETVRVSRLRANEPIPPDEFDVSRHAFSVRFITPDAMKDKLLKPLK